MFSKFIKALFLAFSINLAFSQAPDYIRKYRAEEYGNLNHKKEGILDGNLVRTLFYNTSEIAQWPESPSGEWPKGSGNNYVDGISLLIGAKVVAPANKRVITPIEAFYREEMDRDPVTQDLWGLAPVPGYAKADSEEPAISTKAVTWPELWPRSLPNINSAWDGYWFGYFGRGVHSADLETFFVVDDSKDAEYARLPYNFFPIKDDQNRKGLGLRVEVRGFQWSHVLAEDIIFWHYDIVNLTDNDYNETAFGFYTDTGVGGSGDNGDDMASYSTKYDLTYAFDNDGLGENRQKIGYYGYAYLESPGNGTDGKDNDEDGMVDERRDDGKDNDGDWIPFKDLNGNGKWDANENEPLNSDLGKDGVGPLDLQYNGPDEGEGDGRPTDGEPQFDRTDIDESDMIGLTAVSIYRLVSGVVNGWPKDDDVIWEKMTSARFDTSLQRSNISITFGSATFPLKKYLRERYSMALAFGSDFDDLLFNKKTVQEIYNANYNFSKPPYKPTLKAVAGDGKVYLYWDDVAEKSVDPFLNYKQDFEGYLVYRSTEPEFNDIKVVTDSKGEPKYWKPIAQFDLKDGIKGAHPVGINGAHFYMGDDTGLQHSFIDKDVKNGQRYFYALVSYDMGLEPVPGKGGLSSTECTKIISMDFAGDVKFVDINCAQVTPNAPVAGYMPPSIEGDIKKVAKGIGTGDIKLEIVEPDAIKSGAIYKVNFKAKYWIPTYETEFCYVTRELAGKKDTVVRNISVKDFAPDFYSPVFDGISISINNAPKIEVDLAKSNWLKGTSNLTMKISLGTNTVQDRAWPSDYEVRFYDAVKTYDYAKKYPLNLAILNTTRGDTCKVWLDDKDKSKTFSLGDELVIVEFVDNDPSKFRTAWRIQYDALKRTNGTYIQEPILPKAGDIFVVKTHRPFNSGDYFEFKSIPPKVDASLAQNNLKGIAVVPNPYIANASWEARNLNRHGRGQRRIDFINLPQQCSVRIYTVSGALVTTLQKEASGTLDGSLSWNLVSDDGMDVAYGLYVYHVDAPGVGTHVGKFAIIK